MLSRVQSLLAVAFVYDALSLPIDNEYEISPLNLASSDIECTEKNLQ